MMHRTDSYFRRNPSGSSLRRFSFRRKLTRESLTLPSSIWTYQNQQWQLSRGNPIDRYSPHAQQEFLSYLIDDFFLL